MTRSLLTGQQGSPADCPDVSAAPGPHAIPRGYLPGCASACRSRRPGQDRRVTTGRGLGSARCRVAHRPHGTRRC